jgi:asparagine synthase (glutamine-hydrolysing)
MDLKEENRIDRDIIMRMNKKLEHRGPDQQEVLIEENAGVGFVRLSIIDIHTGMQPIYNEDRSILLICNGEIYNYKELNAVLKAKKHIIRTGSDCECLVHLYEEYGMDFMNMLNGQFAFFIYDKKKKLAMGARDHVGIAPLYYTITDGFFLFASEIKAILEHPAVERKIDLAGLDQVMTFPGLISPRTLFKGIKSLKPGNYFVVNGDHQVQIKEYWDMIYPKMGEMDYKEDEKYYAERLDELLTQAVKYRLQSDVPVGFYISGGLDSSVIAGKISQIDPLLKQSFSIDFADRDISEGKYQRMMADYIHVNHNESKLEAEDIMRSMRDVVYHAECVIKESYNTATKRLSEMAHNSNIKVVLTGEGADELFGGYIGYRFDKLNQMVPRQKVPDLQEEEKLRQQAWGDYDFLYEKNFHAFNQVKKGIYSQEVVNHFDDISCLNHFIVEKERIENVDILHKRSYVDFKLRMADHLLGDHGDRMAFSNSVEARFPFLDKNVIEFALTMPPSIKLKEFDEKYILKKASESYVPKAITKRPKFAFTAPGSSEFLKRDREFMEEYLSYSRIKKSGIYNADKIEQLKKDYVREDFKLNMPYDNDYLMVVLTTEMLMQEFNLSL